MIWQLIWMHSSSHNCIDNDEITRKAHSSSNRFLLKEDYYLEVLSKLD